MICLVNDYNDGYEFTGILKQETAHAYLVDDGELDIWLPKSRTDLRFIGKKSKEGKKVYQVTVPYWLAEKEGII